MITIRLYAHKILPVKNEVTQNHFRAIGICDTTATLLADMFKGKADCSSCGVVQYSDTVYIEELSEIDEEFITKAFPFVCIYRPLVF